ncbi:NAD-binding protein [Sanghuangporus baumii]|uniref:NAD-binding protein n=1 Tax=Sanghuangporus baumii TaxID=108892 RepID=A0A9Q5N5D9_SANBA|nr:NAD-binding protein [Sanghuangporus baumii]
MAKQSVIVIGATGVTGSSIVTGLLENGSFVVIAGTRPSSASKPRVEALKARGVEIRIIDLENWTVDQIAESLNGVDTVISTIFFAEIPRQKLLVDACKKAGVKRFVPDDWATVCVRGVRQLYDQVILFDNSEWRSSRIVILVLSQKLAIRDYVKEIGISYTFIDIGWWMQLTPPLIDIKFPLPVMKKAMTSRTGSGNVKCAVTDNRDIGKFVARIIADDRTLNQYVFCWSQEVTLNETIALAERISGSKIDIENINADEMAKLVKDSSDKDRTATEYVYSLWVLGDNTVENAKKEEYGGALDARELYPDIGKELKTIEDFAKEFYSK